MVSKRGIVGGEGSMNNVLMMHASLSVPAGGGLLPYEDHRLAWTQSFKCRGSLRGSARQYLGLPSL